MFDFFKRGFDIYAEINGFDTEKMKEERLLKSKKEKRLLSKPVRVIIFIVGIMYLLLSISNISLALEGGGNLFVIVKHTALCLLVFVVLVSLFFKGKKAEIFSICGVAVFILANYITAMFTA